jgi:diadenosine tetraphosphatase ApaH/serine/threonine PP2A family protein phosphatase
MRCLVVSDVHANLAAFEAVHHDANPFDVIWCLGDMVGYGPDPNACIDRLREHPHVCLAGNHDWAVLGKLDIRGFNADARIANQWTQGVINQAARDYLRNLPPLRVEQGYTLAHGSPRQPIWEYILDPLTAELNFTAFETQICLVGHTHVPVSFYISDDNDNGPCEPRPPRYGKVVSLADGRWIINPGSVGQPRDGDPDASYAILDLDANTLEHRRVEYPIEETQEKMREVKLPVRLIERLSVGH